MTSILIIIRSDSKPSRKASFVIQLFRSNVNGIFYVFRRNVLAEKWDKNQVELAGSISAKIAYYCLKFFQSPSDIRDAAFRRLLGRTIAYSLINEGFLSTLWVPLNQYFVIPSQTANLLALLKKTNSKKIFLIDEFVSINLINPRILKELGKIIYVSQDVGYNHFGYAERSFSRNLIYKLEKNAVCLADLVIACSEMEKQIYIEMGAKKVISYPNIYPIPWFEPSAKDEKPCISIVLPERWGPRAEKSLNEIFEALSHVKTQLKVYMIGIKPKLIPGNIKMEYYKSIPQKLDYLKTLGKSWIGINIGIHLGGTNEKKYDYALADLVVLSDKLGVRGDLLPHEYAYADYHDLIAKLEQLLEFGKEKIVEMGIKNRMQTLSIAEKQQDKLLSAVKTFEFMTNKENTKTS